VRLYLREGRNSQEQSERDEDLELVASLMMAVMTFGEDSGHWERELRAWLGAVRPRFPHASSTASLHLSLVPNKARSARKLR
jgi:hypothetical protein